MKSLFSLFLFCLLSVVSFAQQDIIDQFPDMPAEVTNEQLLQKGRNYNQPLSIKISNLLNRTNASYFPIGKIETKKAYILILGDVSFDHDPNREITVRVSQISLTKKKFKEVAGSSRSYLTMAGEDALKRVGAISYQADKLIFKLESFDSTTGRKDTHPTSNTVKEFTVGKRDLE